MSAQIFDFKTKSAFSQEGLDFFHQEKDKQAQEIANIGLSMMAGGFLPKYQPSRVFYEDFGPEEADLAEKCINIMRRHITKAMLDASKEIDEVLSDV